MTSLNEWFDKLEVNLELLTSDPADPKDKLTLEEQNVLLKVRRQSTYMYEYKPTRVHPTCMYTSCSIDVIAPEDHLIRVHFECVGCTFPCHRCIASILYVIHVTLNVCRRTPKTILRKDEKVYKNYRTLLTSIQMRSSLVSFNCEPILIHYDLA